MPATIAAARRPPAAGPPSVIGPAAEPRAPFEAPGAREPSTIADLIQVNPRVAASHARSTGVAASGSPRIALSGTERRRQLEVLAAEVAACTACPLHQTRNRTAFARGNPDAELVFVGEGPGTQEDLQGEPFVGPAGQLLDKMIAAMGYERDDVYIMNVVKCRPFEHGNPQKDRKPEPDELAACRPFFDRQLELLEPKVMVALGATAVQALTGASAGITRLRGTWRLYRGRIPLMPTFHPAYLLRSPEKKRDVWDDLQQVMQRLGREAPKKGR
ncbi:MAG: uracil-DNA glycosylase [Deltaproteobacteria bacterium]|nr:uracil-DNA glycosylase [Deltaproteobacteria bacterium]